LGVYLRRAKILGFFPTAFLAFRFRGIFLAPIFWERGFPIFGPNLPPFYGVLKRGKNWGLFLKSWYRPFKGEFFNWKNGNWAPLKF